MEKVTKHESEVANVYQVVAMRDKQYDPLIARFTAIETPVLELKDLVVRLRTLQQAHH
ncbi:MAG: hypothetical protein U0103_03495 [Candidatus Obscuribacterales bacterium]|nr:hypothetical protein [Cyanobacteria bacterium SZAS LIN-5]